MPQTVADTGPVSWDLGPGAQGHREYSPATCVVHQPSCTLLSSGAPGAAAVPSSVCDVPTWGTAVGASLLPTECFKTELFRPAGKAVSISFAFVFLEDFLWLCLLLHFP